MGAGGEGAAGGQRSVRKRRFARQVARPQGGLSWAAVGRLLSTTSRHRLAPYSRVPRACCGQLRGIVPRGETLFRSCGVWSTRLDSTELTARRQRTGTTEVAFGRVVCGLLWAGGLVWTHRSLWMRKSWQSGRWRSFRVPKRNARTALSSHRATQYCTESLCFFFRTKVAVS